MLNQYSIYRKYTHSKSIWCTVIYKKCLHTGFGRINNFKKSCAKSNQHYDLCLVDTIATGSFGSTEYLKTTKTTG